MAIPSAIPAADKAAQPESRTPVMVELFTSEGCSSCPPADLLLEKLDQSQPVSGAAIIALSEHVDYWNYIGWTDPYSSPVFSARQAAYARRFHLDGSYTPQMIVDGAVEFVGSDGHRAEAAISAAAKLEKVPVHLSAGMKTLRIEVAALPGSAGPEKAGVYFALARDRGTSDVMRGENQGRRLHHVAIAKNIQHLGSVSAKAPFAREVPFGENGDLQNLRVIVFVQEPGNGRVWGAAVLRPATDQPRQKLQDQTGRGNAGATARSAGVSVSRGRFILLDAASSLTAALARTWDSISASVRMNNANCGSASVEVSRSRRHIIGTS